MSAGYPHLHAPNSLVASCDPHDTNAISNEGGKYLIVVLHNSAEGEAHLINSTSIGIGSNPAPEELIEKFEEPYIAWRCKNAFSLPTFAYHSVPREAPGADYLVFREIAQGYAFVSAVRRELLHPGTFEQP
jgi:hypothetical protein